MPLPFISYAPTNLCVMLAGVGLLLNISRPGARRWKVVEAPQRDAPRIVIGAGGTAGHVVPALAVADALRAEGAEVTFVGGERAERELVPAAGYELRHAARRAAAAWAAGQARGAADRRRRGPRGARRC